MVLFNHATREMTAKIVYYGPGLCGKTTNLMVIFDKLDPKSKGKMLSLATKTDRTLFFDLLPVDIGKVGPFNLKIQLYTVPGQVFYNETRKLVLKGADSVVFVADSQPAMVEANRESFNNLLENMEQNQIDVNDTPIVIQYNKRDIPGVLPVETLQEQLGFEGYPYMEASALRGDGVMETFKLASKITAKHLFARLKGGTGKAEPAKRPVTASAPAPAAIEPEAPESVAATPMNPFAGSVPSGEASIPFPEATPDADYDNAEEVSLDQLLAEGRERPATFAGNVAVPYEEIEELGADQLVPAEETPVAVTFDDTQTGGSGNGRVAQLETEVQQLQQRLRSMKDEHRAAMETILRDLGELTARVRAEID